MAQSAFIYHKILPKGGKHTCHISPQNLDQTRISMPLSDTFSETVVINLPNDQMKNRCLSPHFFVKSNHKVRATKSWKKTLQKLPDQCMVWTYKYGLSYRKQPI